MENLPIFLIFYVVRTFGLVRGSIFFRRFEVQFQRMNLDSEGSRHTCWEGSEGLREYVNVATFQLPRQRQADSNGVIPEKMYKKN